VDRRKSPRYKRRIPTRFWSQEDPKPRRGFTLNISELGIFVATYSPFSVVTLIKLELALDERMIHLEGQVRLAFRVAPELRKVKTSGMGVRLFRTEEIMQGLIRPRQDNHQQEAPDGASSGSGPADRRGDESHPSIFSVHIDTPADLAKVFNRHIRHGGVFVPTPGATDVEELVGVEFLLDWSPETVIQTTGKVVKTFSTVKTPRGEHGLAGIGVAFSSPEETIAQFRQLLSVPESPSAISSHS